MAGEKPRMIAYKPEGVSGVHRERARYSIRLWSVRNAGLLEWFYARFADGLLKLHWFWNKVGYQRAERPVKAVEKLAKAVLFDCRMCGQCALSSTGMSCPMNCPKGLRNGPCGGVRANGHCEVEPDMPCVWVQAWQGSQRMKTGDRILDVQKPVDNSLWNTSSWLRVTAKAAAERAQAAAQASTQAKGQ
ncbi:MAG: methylenetetrahydrofolate reductase C-terminal domain-containing protein [Rhodobiaceae bacterium]|nr:methylenetetrahydrofolate reductase C-terminal domain-containing protein [Rhodobiaceae bacterium]MCC0041873.1 methylenetetrahydrofolate reductase C-terminal domain-containing protein [Rhodobiaceae bacterium]